MTVVSVVPRHVGRVCKIRQTIYMTVVSIVDLWTTHDGRVRSTQARRSCP